MNGALGDRFARAVHCFGDPANAPILFVHGIRLGAAIWNAHARALSNEFYVVTVDLPGHAALSDLRFTPENCDALLAYVADHIPGRPPLVVGYSLGGYVAMRYARDLPARSAGLVLAGCATEFIGRRCTAYEMAVGLTAQIPPAFIQKGLEGFFRLTLPRSVAEMIIPFPFDQGVFEDSRRFVCGVRFASELAKYGKPILIVNGEWDPIFRLDEDRFARYAGARIETLKGTDHVAPMRCPEAFTEIVRSFASRLRASSAADRFS